MADPTSPSSKRPSAGCSRCPRTSRCCWLPTRKCADPAVGPRALRLRRPRLWPRVRPLRAGRGSAASSSWASCGTMSAHYPAKPNRTRSFMASAPTAAGSIILPQSGHPENVDGASVGGGLRLGMQPCVTVDLSTAKVAGRATTGDSSSLQPDGTERRADVPRLRHLLLDLHRAARARPRPAAQPPGRNVVGGTPPISAPAPTRSSSTRRRPRHHQLEHVQHRRRRGATRFNQPGTSSIALNRVTGGLGPSMIDGTLTANGRVFIINRDGMLIGAMR